MKNWARAALFALWLLPSAPTFAAASTAPTIDTRFCQALIKHVPDADVAYQPGVDVHGKPVAPADLGSGYNIDLPQEITIPLTVDLKSFLHLNETGLPASAMKRTDAWIGTLTVKGDKVFYDGKPLTNEQQDNLSVLCLKPTR